jgi:5'-AMP-activated protein kinase regulatory gamma subunit
MDGTQRTSGRKRKEAEPRGQDTAKTEPDGAASLKARRTSGEEAELKGVVGTGLRSSQMTAHRTSAEFLAALVYTKAEQLRVPDNKVFIAERTDKVIDVFKGLVKHNFLSVPVLQKTKHKWFGFLDLADIVLYVVNAFGESRLNVEQDFWTLADKEVEFQNKTVNDLMRYPLTRRNPFHPITGGYSLLYAIEALARERSLHRVPVIDDERQLMNLITQSQVIRFLQQNLHLLGDKRLTPAKDMQGVMHQVFAINIRQRAIDAFQQLVEKAVTGVAVVDDTGKLKGNLSLRDLKAMSTDGRFFWRLYQTVDNYLTKLKKEVKEGQRPKRVQSCKASDTLEHAINLLADHSIHRVYVVDDAKKPIGVVTLKDVLCEILAP